jgi:hypothetical protein
MIDLPVALNENVSSLGALQAKSASTPSTPHHPE